MQENGNNILAGRFFIDVKSVGVRWFHPAGFRVERPEGIADYTFVQWLTPSVLVTDGEATRERPGGCIIYRPGEAQSYGADPFTPFGNNWFHFSGVGVEALLEECAIPSGRPFYLQSVSFIESTLQFILWESMAERFEWKRVLSSHAQLFFIEIARSMLQETPGTRTAGKRELFGRFEEFRDRLKARCAEPWTLALMAAELHLSVSQFSRLYREFFQAKPVDDLIGMRVNMAEYYLRTTVMPIHYIANLSGFTDIYYFSRVFKSKTGMTATAYRNHYRADGEEEP